MILKDLFISIASKDERIRMETNRIASKLLFLELGLVLAALVMKRFILQYPIKTCALEGIILFTSILYYVGYTLYLQVPFKKSTDESIGILQEKILSYTFHLTMYLLVFGELLMAFMIEDVLQIVWYFPAWLIPGSIYSFLIVKKGLFIWGTQKKKTDSLKRLKLSTVICSILHGLILSWDHIVVDGSFQPSGLKWALLLGVMFGFPFYFMMKMLVNKSEKRANKQIENLETENA
jgi:hypothetical protein